MLAVDQGTAEWYQARCGLVTASRIADVVAKTRNGWGASRANYAAQLIAERLTGQPADSYQSAAMAWGIEQEPYAREAYEIRTGALVLEVGFAPHPSIELSGASPDGMVGDDGLVEIKCPNTATHIETLLSGGIDKKYLLQMQWQLACTGRRWVDFCSFDPRMPADLRLWVQRVERDDEGIAELEAQVQVFLAEIADKVQRLEALRA